MNDVIYLLHQNTIDDIVIDGRSAAEINSRINNYPEIMEGYYSFTEEDYLRVTALLEDRITVTDVVQSEFEGVKIVQVSYNTDTSIDADEEDYTMEIEEIERQEKDELEKRLKFQEIDKELEKAGVSVASYTTEHERMSDEELEQYEQARHKIDSRHGLLSSTEVNVEFGEVAKKYKDYIFFLSLKSIIRSSTNRIFSNTNTDKEEVNVVVHLLNGFVRKPKDDGKIHIFVNASPVSRKDNNEGEVEYLYGTQESLGYGNRRLSIPKFGEILFNYESKPLGVVVGNNIYIFNDPLTYFDDAIHIVRDRIIEVVIEASNILLEVRKAENRENLSSNLTNLVRIITANSDTEIKQAIERAEHRKELLKQQYLEASREYQNAIMKNNKGGYSKEETDKEINYLLKDKNIVKFWLEGAQLKAQTRTMVIASPRTGDLHRIGRLQISVDINRQSVSVKNLEYKVNPGEVHDGVWEDLPTEAEREEALRSPNTTGFDAPHVDSEYPCFGNMETAVTQLIAENQYGSLISLVANYLESAELGDEFGASLHFWPITNKKDFEKDLKEDAELRQTFLAKFEEEVNVKSEKQRA